jgi:anion-transporting  ArsA/GET3 family ATPase
MDMSIENMRKLIDEHDKTVANLPQINTMHMQEVKKFLTKYADVQTKDDANRVLEYFNSFKEEWSEYYKTHSSDIYPQIHHCIANAYEVLKDTNAAINTLSSIS